MIKSNLILSKYTQTKFYIEYIVEANKEFHYVFSVFESLIHFKIKLTDVNLQDKLNNLQINTTHVIYEELYKKNISSLKQLTFNFIDVDNDENIIPQHWDLISKEINMLLLKLTTMVQ